MTKMVALTSDSSRVQNAPKQLAEPESIIDATDGVMVARGDLGVEMSPAVVPSAQKAIIRAAKPQR